MIHLDAGQVVILATIGLWALFGLLIAGLCNWLLHWWSKPGG